MTEATYPCTITPNFSNPESFVEISSNFTGIQIAFTLDDSNKNLVRFKPVVIHEEYSLSDYPVDFLSFHNTFHEDNITQGMIFKGMRIGNFHNFTMDVDPGYECFEKIRAGVQWYMMDTQDFISNFEFNLKNENGHLVSFNEQSKTFRLPIEEI